MVNDDLDARCADQGQDLCKTRSFDIDLDMPIALGEMAEERLILHRRDIGDRGP